MVCKFRTSLDDFALDILDLIDASLQEALNSATSRQAAIAEAQGGLAALKARLREEDESKLAKLMLVFDIDFDNLQKRSGKEFEDQARDALRWLKGAFSVFGGKLSA
jgi:hypothetical protein